MNKLKRYGCNIIIGIVSMGAVITVTLVLEIKLQIVELYQIYYYNNIGMHL